MKPNSSMAVPRSTRNATEERFLHAISAVLRGRVSETLSDPRLGGRGLRAWLALVEVQNRPLPTTLSDDLVSIYLSDSEAEPLYDCELCGLAVPVRAGRRGGHEPSCDRVYFSSCPDCGGHTGSHAYWSRTASA